MLEKQLDCDRTVEEGGEGEGEDTWLMVCNAAGGWGNNNCLRSFDINCCDIMTLVNGGMHLYLFRAVKSSLPMV